MELQGETDIAAPRERVWAALMDPDVLARCIDGVERLERIEENRFAGTMNAKVGPVRATFQGTVEMTEIDPPRRYVLIGEGKGGVAGFAKGSADIMLDELSDSDAGTTRLRYHVRSQVGGKLAQLGARLIEGTAKAYAEKFFAGLKQEVETPAPLPGADLPPVETAAPPAMSPDDAFVAAERGGVPPLAWGALVAALVLILLLVLLA